MPKKEKTFIEGIYDTYHKSLWGYAYHLSSNSEVANDIVQTVFQKVIAHQDTLKTLNTRKLKAYLSITLKNAYFDYYNSLKKEEKAITEMKTQNELVSSDLTIERIVNRDLLARLKLSLSERERHIIYLAYDLDMKRKEIASTMNISENNVNVTIHQAVEKMRAALGNLEEGDTVEKRKQ